MKKEPGIGNRGAGNRGKREIRRLRILLVEPRGVPSPSRILALCCVQNRSVSARNVTIIHFRAIIQFVRLDIYLRTVKT